MRRRSLLSLALVAGAVACGAHGEDPSSPSGVEAGVPPADDAGPDTKPATPTLDGGLSDVTLPARDGDADGYVAEDDCDDGDALINPGAIEVAGDKVDNDCNGLVDEPPVECDKGLLLDTHDGLDLARSLGLCQTTAAGAKGKARTWGVIQAGLTTSDGKGAPLPRQWGVQRTFGDAVKARAGESMVALSNGVARTPGQPLYVPLPKGVDSTGNASAAPDGWPRNTKGCPASTKHFAFDSVALDLTIRVPTNVRSFHFDFDFYTSEYVEYVCQAYNDTFVALLDGKTALDPAAAGNISFDGDGDPVNVNSGFFQACAPDSWLGRSFDCPLGVGELKGTGFDAVSSSLGKPAQNGATSWLRTTQSVVPGDEVRLRLMIWNTGDHWLPSTVLLDAFTWSADPAKGSHTDRPK